LSKTAIIIPIKKFDKSKTRLSPFLDANERKELTEYLIIDLLGKLCELENSQIIIVTGERINSLEKFNDIVIINEINVNGVNNAIGLANEFVEKGGFKESLIIPIDLPLLCTKDIKDILKFSGRFENGICIVPSRRYDGTNVLLRKPNLIIDTSYDNNSFYNHIKKTVEKKKVVKIFNYENLMIDLDTIEDAMTIINRFNEMIDSDKIEDKLKYSNSINFLKEIMENKITSI
jgi:2-phospho-L-lactate/phosphoenolpyruvate guanylyltransferase